MTALQSLVTHLRAAHVRHELLERRERSEKVFELYETVTTLPHEPLCLYYLVHSVTSCTCRRKRLLGAARAQYRRAWRG